VHGRPLDLLGLGLNSDPSVASGPTDASHNCVLALMERNTRCDWDRSDASCARTDPFACSSGAIYQSISFGIFGVTWKVAISSGLNLKFGSYFFGFVMESGSVDRQAKKQTGHR
jgi:hypothetical protein